MPILTEKSSWGGFILGIGITVILVLVVSYVTWNYANDAFTAGVCSSQGFPNATFHFEDDGEAMICVENGSVVASHLCFYNRTDGAWPCYAS